MIIKNMICKYMYVQTYAYKNSVTFSKKYKYDTYIITTIIFYWAWYVPRYQTFTIAAMHVVTTLMELESKLIIKDKIHISMVTQCCANTFITMATQHTQVVYNCCYACSHHSDGT